MVTNNSSGQPAPCSCNPELMKHDIQCDNVTCSLVVPDGVWVGPISDTATCTSLSDLAVHKCVLQNCGYGRRKVDIRTRSVNYDTQCRSDYDRTGILCGTCKPGYTAAFGTRKCLKCSNSAAALLPVYLAVGVLLILAIVLLRINIAAGYLNGVLFYSNIVSMYGPFLTPADIDGERLLLANWLSLWPGHGICFHAEMSDLEKSWWGLSFPLYLFVLMLLLSLMASYCRCVSRVGHHIIQAFATLFVLCYVSLLDSCVKLLAGVTLETTAGNITNRWLEDTDQIYFQGWHGFMASLSIIVILFYFVPLSVFLLFPKTLYSCPLRRFQKLKPLYDSFWNPYKPEYRFWLAIRLFFRWPPFMLAYFAQAPLNVFVTVVLLVLLLFFQLFLQPFQGSWRNFVDGYFLVNLIILLVGGLYFGAEYRERVSHVEQDRELTDFSTAVVTLGYLGIAGVILYHLYLRFKPTLKTWYRASYLCLLKRERAQGLPPSEASSLLQEYSSCQMHASAAGTTVIEHNHGNNEHISATARGGRVRYVDYTVLRESLLDSQRSVH